MQELTTEFYEAKFTTRVASRMQYDQHTQFNESNITSYLAELEEYIFSLITYQAYQQGDPNAAISSVPLDQLHRKEFEWRKLEIDCPTDVTRVGETSTNAESLDDENPHTFPRPKETYQRVIDQLEKG